MYENFLRYKMMFGSLFSKTPANRHEMEVVFEKNLEQGKFQDATKVVWNYRKRIIGSDLLTLKQSEKELAICHFLLCKATYKAIFSDEKYQNHEYYKAFFVCHIEGHRNFQSLLLSNDGNWDEKHKLWPKFKKFNLYYSKLYENFDNEDLHAADIEANEILKRH